MHLSTLSLATLVAAVMAMPRSDYVLHEKRNLASTAWAKLDAVPEDTSLPMRIGLKQGNLHKGGDLLMEVSDPTSAKYGKYYTADEVADYFSPSDSTIESIRQWLEESGIDNERVSLSANKGWIQFDAPAKEAGDLLKTKFHFYEHVSSGDANVACDE